MAHAQLGKVLASEVMVLMGNFMGEKLRTPALLEMVREHAVEPRVNLVERVLQNLRDRKAVRADVDTHTVAAFFRGDTDTADLAHRVASTIWSGIAAS